MCFLDLGLPHGLPPPATRQGLKMTINACCGWLPTYLEAFFMVTVVTSTRGYEYKQDPPNAAPFLVSTHSTHSHNIHSQPLTHLLTSQHKKCFAQSQVGHCRMRANKRNISSVSTRRTQVRNFWTSQHVSVRQSSHDLPAKQKKSHHPRNSFAAVVLDGLNGADYLGCRPSLGTSRWCINTAVQMYLAHKMISFGLAFTNEGTKIS